MEPEKFVPPLLRKSYGLKARLTAICLATCVGLNTVYTMYFHLFGWSII